jgi:hypothetical protein
MRGRKKDTIDRTVRISVKRPHQMGPMLGDQKEGKKQGAFPIKEQKGSANINMIEEGSNCRHSKDLTPKSKPKPPGRRWAQRKKRKKCKVICMQSHMQGELDKPNNAFDAIPR